MIRVNGIWQQLETYNGRTFSVRQSGGQMVTYERLRTYDALDFIDGVVPKGFNGGD